MALTGEAVLSGSSSEVTQALLVSLYLSQPPRRLPSRVTAPATAPDRSRRPAPGTPVPVARATDFIERYAAEPLGLVEIAQAAGLSPRALQAAFRRHLGTTPLGHLRAVRLTRAHADLQSARPGDGRSVSTVASAWGFSQLSRFARDYRRQYGVPPHQTLGSRTP